MENIKKTSLTSWLLCFICRIKNVWFYLLYMMSNQNFPGCSSGSIFLLLRIWNTAYYLLRAAAFYTFQNCFHLPPSSLQRTNLLALQFTPFWFSLLCLNSRQLVHVGHGRMCQCWAEKKDYSMSGIWHAYSYRPTYSLSASKQKATITQVQPVICTNRRSLLNEQVMHDDYGWGCASCAVWGVMVMIIIYVNLLFMYRLYTFR